jgi:hypothetical protein
LANSSLPFREIAVDLAIQRLDEVLRSNNQELIVNRDMQKEMNQISHEGRVSEDSFCRDADFPRQHPVKHRNYAGECLMIMVVNFRIQIGLDWIQ